MTDLRCPAGETAKPGPTVARGGRRRLATGVPSYGHQRSGPDGGGVSSVWQGLAWAGIVWCPAAAAAGAATALTDATAGVATDLIFAAASVFAAGKPADG